MNNLEKLSTNLQEKFEISDYIITSIGFFEDTVYFSARREKISYDIMISDEIIDFIPCEENESILKLYNLVEPRNLVKSYLNHHDFKIVKFGTLVEEYQMQQIPGFYFQINENSNNIQIKIYPGDYAIPILLEEEPTIPELSRAEFFGSFDDSEIKEFTDQYLEIPQDKNRNINSLKKPKKVGRNEPCTCGSGMKYKKCCGNIIKK